MAKKSKATNQAELENELKDDEQDAEVAAKQLEHKRKMEARSTNGEEMVFVQLPKLASGAPVEIQINNKIYKGLVEVPASMAPQLREMADKIVDRESNIYVGKKYKGTGTGNRGMRRQGNV